MTTQPRELAALPPEVRRLVHAADRIRDDHAESNPERRNALWTDLHQATDDVWGRDLTWYDHLTYQADQIVTRVRHIINQPNMR